MPDFPEGVALVVGGSGGIGSAIARGFAAADVTLAITYRHNEERAQEVAEGIRAGGGVCTVHQVALGDLSSVKACLDELAAEHGQIHTIAHAAGTHIDQPYVSQLTPEQWRNTMDWDVNGFFHVVHSALPHLRKSQGSIVFVSSAGLKRFPPGDVLSVAPKGAIEALMRGIAREEGRYGVRANNVAVGVVDAGMFPKLVERGRAQPGMDRCCYAQHTSAPLRDPRGNRGCRGVLGVVPSSVHHRADFVRRWRLHVVVAGRAG